MVRLDSFCPPRPEWEVEPEEVGAEVELMREKKMEVQMTKGNEIKNERNSDRTRMSKVPDFWPHL